MNEDRGLMVRVAALEAEVSALKGEKEPKKKPWLLCGDGFVINAGLDHRGYAAQGNAFATKAEAELESKRRAVRAKLKVLSAEYSALGTTYYRFYLMHTTHGWCVGSCGGFIEGVIDFHSVKSAENAIRTLGSELDVLLPETR